MRRAMFHIDGALAGLERKIKRKRRVERLRACTYRRRSRMGPLYVVPPRAHRDGGHQLLYHGLASVQHPSCLNASRGRVYGYGCFLGTSCVAQLALLRQRAR
jgi:hypothetical protein